MYLWCKRVKITLVDVASQTAAPNSARSQTTPGAVELSRATLRKIHQNLFWAVAHSVVAFTAADRVFYALFIGPEVAAPAMPGSSALSGHECHATEAHKLGGHASGHRQSMSADHKLHAFNWLCPEQPTGSRGLPKPTRKPQYLPEPRK